MRRGKFQLGEYVETVIEHALLDDIDADENTYPDWASWEHLRIDLAQVIEAAVADWLIKQRAKAGTRP